MESNVEFVIGDLFDPSDHLSQFVVMVGAAYNDLVFTNDLLVNGRVGKIFEGERLYLFRVMASHALEFCHLLRESKGCLGVESFLASLGQSTLDVRDELIGLLDKENKTKAALAMQRNKVTFHYEKPKSKELREAILAVAGHTDSWRRGGSHAQSRAEFADEIVVQLLVPSGDGTSKEKLIDLMTMLKPLSMKAIDLCRLILDGYEGPSTRS